MPGNVQRIRMEGPPIFWGLPEMVFPNIAIAGMTSPFSIGHTSTHFGSILHCYVSLPECKSKLAGV